MIIIKQPSKLQRLGKWAVSKVPKWMLSYKRTHPKTFWTVIIILLLLPFSPVTFAVLHWLSSVWAWMFAVK